MQRQGRRVATRHLILLGRPNDLDHDRLGIIASRRFGHAVSRARARRRLREMFRRHEPDTAREQGRPPIDIVAIPRREMLEAPFEALTAEFAAAVKRLRGTR